MTDEEALAAYAALAAEEERHQQAVQDVARRRGALVRRALTDPADDIKRSGRQVAELLGMTPSRVSQLAQRAEEGSSA